MRTHLKLVTLTTFIGLLLACGAAVNQTPNIAAANATATPSPSKTTDQLASGLDLYKTNCAECHRDDGKGGEKVVDGKKIDAKDLTGERMKKRSDAKLYDDIAEGSPDDGMPAFEEKLKAAEINEIVKYIRSDLQKAPAGDTK